MGGEKAGGEMNWSERSKKERRTNSYVYFVKRGRENLEGWDPQRYIRRTWTFFPILSPSSTNNKTTISNHSTFHFLNYKGGDFYFYFRIRYELMSSNT